MCEEDAMPKQISPDDARRLLDDMDKVLLTHLEALERLRTALGAEDAADKVGDAIAEAAAMSRGFAAACHDLKFTHDWRIAPQPEWFDHFLDVYLQLRRSRNTFWMERGIFGMLALRRGGNFLELCSGDGFNAHHFYAPFANRHVAVDFDADAIAHAQRYNRHETIEYRLADIRTDVPEGPFDTVLWDAAIEHFTEEEIADLMAAIKKRLTPEGCLSGYTVVAQEGGKHLCHHEREFHSMADLSDFLAPYFRNVRVFETIHPERHNLYFYASDGVLPFDEDWPHMLVRRASDAG